VKYLVDTNVISEIRKPNCHPSVRRWQETVSSADLYLSVLVVGEIARGIARLRARDPRQAAVFEDWLERLRIGYADRLLPVTDAVAVEWGRMSFPDPLPTVDGLLAATAKVYGMTLVTRNTKDFPPGAPVLNPFEEGPSF